jgi:hypothetical protein
MKRTQSNKPATASYQRDNSIPVKLKPMISGTEVGSINVTLDELNAPKRQIMFSGTAV